MKSTENQLTNDAAAEIAALKEKLAVYEQQQNRFRTIFETSDVAQKIIDHDLKIIEINDAMCDLLGYSSKEILGTKIMYYTHSDFIEQWHQLQLALWDHELTNFQLEACLLKKDGTEIWCIIHTMLFKDDGKTFGYTLLEDITVRKQLERHKDEFVSVVAHELRTPLTTKKTQCQLLEMQIPAGEASKFGELTKGLNKHINRLTRLIDNLVLVSKIEKGLTVSQVQPYHIDSLIRKVIEDLRLSHPKRKFTDALSGIATNGDEEKIRQVLYNLLGNAVKFSSTNQTIDISLKRKEKCAEICIQDYGSGIPKKDFEHIFKRFYQVEEKGNKHLAGMGLGLYKAGCSFGTADRR